MRSLKFTIAKNATANIMRGGASAVVAIVLPHFLTRALDGDHFAGWALMLQLTAYVNYLDFGLQTAVARFLAGAEERRDSIERGRIISTSLFLLAAAGALALIGVALLAWQLPNLFRSVPAAIIFELRGGLLLLGSSAAIGLPLSTFTGVLIGVQRNELPAIAIAGSRLAGAILVMLVVRHTQSLIWLAFSVALFNVIGAAAQYLFVRRLLPDLRADFSLVDRGMSKELIQYCSTLTVWSLAMLFIAGLDVTIVGLFNFEAVGAYALATTLIAFFTGINSSAFSAMMAPVAVLQARGEYSRIKRLLIITTRMNSYFSLAAIAFTFVYGEALVKAWVGPQYLSLTLPILKILLVAQAVRLLGSAYGTVLVSMGLQKFGILPVIIEGGSNICLSIVGMIWIGPLGVAAATLVAAILAMASVVVLILPRVPDIAISQKIFVWQGIVIPCMAFLPIFGWMLYHHSRFFTGELRLSTSLASLLTLILIIRGVKGARSLNSGF